MHFRLLRSLLLYSAGQSLLVFLPYGTLSWVMGWVYVTVCAVTAYVVLRWGDPGMIEVRRRWEPNAKTWDVYLATISGFLFWPIPIVVAGLDVGRFHWGHPIPFPVSVVAMLLFAGGLAFACRAMLANRFFSKFVSIQKSRHHIVIDRGPYQTVRHPGYGGAAIAFLALPVALGSWLAVVPAAVGVLLLGIRTYWEDATLQHELAGYADYAARVRYRLIPWIW